MGCFGGAGVDQTTKMIDTKLKNDGRVFKEEIKILLLGPGESGKSTVFKQMKLIQQGGGFSEDERQHYKVCMYTNLITQMRVLISNMEKLGISLENPENKDRLQKVASTPPSPDFWTPELGQDIKILWADKGIKDTFSHKDKPFQLDDSCEYFLNELERILQPNFNPNDQDVLRVRVRTTGIEEAIFQFDDFKFRMLDVGGQRSERRKWIHCFDSVTAVIFCASLIEYDMVLREDETQNRMKETLALFADICNSRWFQKSDIILFLNKIDVFRTKITQVDLSVLYPEYAGGADYDKATSFLEAEFKKQNNSAHSLFAHLTCAINTENVEFVFSSVRKMLLDKSVADCGLE